MTQNAITAETHPLINVIEENIYENKNHLKLDNLSSKRINFGICGTNRIDTVLFGTDKNHL